MFARNESLMRSVVGGLGAALFGMSCLLAAAGPVRAETPTQIVQPAAFTPQS